MSDEKRLHINKSPSLFGLLFSRRFAPFFLTQFLGAFNDNMFKSGILLFFTYYLTLSIGALSFLNNLAALLFIAPFFLFSPIAGQLADKIDKSKLIQAIKLFEVIVMLNGALAFFLQNTIYLLVVLFLMGTKSAFFGPVKYSIIPQHLYSTELVSGNAWVEAGTFIAILFGAISTGLLSYFESATFWVACSVLLFSILGLISSLFILSAPSSNADLKIDFQFLRQVKETLKITKSDRLVYAAILCISWFWFLGASYLTQILQLTKVSLHADESIATFLLIMFSVGVAIGSLLCEKISRHCIELGVVPLAGLGMSFFGVHLALLAQGFQNVDLVISIKTMFDHSALIMIVIDIIVIGMMGGLYIVPLYAWIQQHTPPDRRARLIAGNNILNAFFMVLSALFGIFILSVLHLSLPVFFILLSIANFVFLGVIFWKEKIFFERAAIFLKSFQHK